MMQNVPLHQGKGSQRAYSPSSIPMQRRDMLQRAPPNPAASRGRGKPAHLLWQIESAHTFSLNIISASQSTRLM